MAKRVADEVFAVGRQLGATPKELLAAAMTGIVESGFRNLPGGDADSQGWRQERASLYPNPTDVRASARRFFQEAKQFNRPGISAGDLAARVQRPAAQYRGRYSQVRGQAQSLLGGAGGGGGGSAAQGSAQSGGSSGGQTTTSLPDFGSQQSQLPLIQALLDSQQQAGPPAANIQAPSFTAHPVLPEGFGTVSGGGGPAPKADIGALAAAVKTLGGDVPASQQVTQSQQQGVSGATGGGGSFSGENVKTNGYPLGRIGRIIGTPFSGTHTLGDWQSDRAVDIATPVGTPMVALEGGTVVKVRHHPQDGGRFAGDQITIRGANNSYFYAHGVANVKPGQKVHTGDVIGKSGSANGTPHLHFGVEHGDPRKIIARRR